MLVGGHGNTSSGRKNFSFGYCWHLFTKDSPSYLDIKVMLCVHFLVIFSTKITNSTIITPIIVVIINTC